MSKKQKIAYRIYRSKPDSNYSQLSLEVLCGEESCAAKDYDECPGERNLDRLQKIRALGKSTKYFSGTNIRETAFNIHWQADRDRSCDEDNNNSADVASFPDWQWYAARIENLAFDTGAAKLAAKLCAAAGYDPSPSKVLDILESMGARRVFHNGDCPFGAYIYQENYDRAELAENPWRESVGAA